jgi:hypothetical protein
MPDGRLAITDWHGKVLGYGKGKCKKISPHERGAWISSERCSYHFEVGGRWYSGRGRGDGVAVTLRPMKTKPKRDYSFRGRGRR